MSMEDLWPRQSVHGWVLFLGIKSVYYDYKQKKVKEITEASASVGLLLATAVPFSDGKNARKLTMKLSMYSFLEKATVSW